MSDVIAPPKSELGGSGREKQGSAQPQVASKGPISTKHLAKGLEFRAVAVMACDDEVLPSQHRIESVTDEALEEVYKHGTAPLYVACTRARGAKS